MSVTGSRPAEPYRTTAPVGPDNGRNLQRLIKENKANSNEGFIYHARYSWVGLPKGVRVIMKETKKDEVGLARISEISGY